VKVPADRALVSSVSCFYISSDMMDSRRRAGVASRLTA
jgi:hypothetical protein